MGKGSGKREGAEGAEGAEGELWWTDLAGAEVPNYSSRPVLVLLVDSNRSRLPRLAAGPRGRRALLNHHPIARVDVDLPATAATQTAVAATVPAVALSRAVPRRRLCRQRLRFSDAKPSMEQRCMTQR